MLLTTGAVSLFCCFAVVCGFLLIVPCDGAYYFLYPRSYFYSRYTYVYSSTNTETNLIDQTIYTNFIQHCNDTPAYSMAYNERYRIYGSVPMVYDASSPFVDSNGVPLSAYLTDSCQFTLTAPPDYGLSVTFKDSQCATWPAGCSLKVYEGDYFSAYRGNKLLQLPAYSTCSQDFRIYSSVLSFDVQSCFPNPSTNFNFSMTVKAFSTGSVTVSSTAAYSSFIALVITIVIIIIVIRCCCCTNGRRYYVNCCCCPKPIYGSAVYPLPPSQAVGVTSTSTILDQSRSSIMIQPNGDVVKYERDVNGNVHAVNVNQPPPYPDNGAPPPPYPDIGWQIPAPVAPPVAMTPGPTAASTHSPAFSLQEQNLEPHISSGAPTRPAPPPSAKPASIQATAATTSEQEIGWRNYLEVGHPTTSVSLSVSATHTTQNVPTIAVTDDSQPISSTSTTAPSPALSSANGPSLDVNEIYSGASTGLVQPLHAIHTPSSTQL